MGYIVIVFKKDSDKLFCRNIRFWMRGSAIGGGLEASACTVIVLL